VVLLGTSVNQGELGQFYRRQSGKAVSRSWGRDWSLKMRKGSRKLKVALFFSAYRWVVGECINLDSHNHHF